MPSTSSRPLAYYYLMALVAVTALMLTLGSVLIYHSHHLRQVNVRFEAATKAQSVAARLYGWGSQQRALIRAIADDPQLARMFRERDSQGLADRARVLAPLFPGGLGLELMPVEVVGAAAKGSEELGYAALDLLRAAESGERVPPLEVHRFGSPEAHIALASRVPASGEGPALGLIMVRLPLARLRQQLGLQRDFPGTLVLQQRPGGAGNLRLAAVGKEQNRPPDGAVKIGDSIWRLAYWYAAEPDSRLSLLGDLWPPAILALGWLLLAAIMLVHYRRLGRDLAADLDTLVETAKCKLHGRPPPARAPKLSELARTVQRLQQLSRPTAAAQAVASAPASAPQSPASNPPAAADMKPAPEPGGGSDAAATELLPREIFRRYDIRGLVGQSLTPKIFGLLGQAFASEALDRGERSLVVGRDGRLSSAELHAAFCQGLQVAGAEVIDLGQVPTPLVYFATQFLASDSGAMITGSHNPAAYNGLKLVLQGETLADAALQALRIRIEEGNLRKGEGSCLEQDLVPDYVARVSEDVQLARPLRLVVDCGNGVAGPVVLRLLRELGCEVVELFCEVDGSFPNHHPDPSQPDNLLPLIMEVGAQEADLGLAFDGDGDRLGVVDSSGKIIWPDRLLMLLLEQVLAMNPGADILFDVKSSHHLADHIRSLSGRPVLCPTGHSLLKAKARETGAPLAGEMSGHILFQDRWNGFDDAFYAAARLLEVLALDPRPSAEVFADLPESPSTPELLLDLDEGEPQAMMERLIVEARFDGAQINHLDGLRVEFPDGWGLMRASNTTPALSFRFEADSESRLKELKELFRVEILTLYPGLKLPF